ncbi:endonuclease [Acholeplasma granularum]|uniref:endonuclease n=1 Tax=Acholeplasma granularum TaxID=264635 RepID=UPI00046EACB5|nr:endonuclease [Acholeplasma granularum]
MKKIISILLFAISVFTLVACDDELTKNQNFLNEALASIDITYETGDSINSVTKDITLGSLSDKFSTVTLEWSSNIPSVVSIVDDKAVIYRRQENTEVTITATIVFNEVELYRDFNITVLGINQVPNEEVPTDGSPIISGVKNVEIKVDESNVNLLTGITAKDINNKALTVILDDSKVDYTKAGRYEITYKATDENNKTSTKVAQLRIIGFGSSTNALYKFEFPSTDLSHGYSDPAIDSVLTDSISNSSFAIKKRRANVGQGGEGLIISGTSSSETLGWVEFDFKEVITKMSFMARLYSDKDLALVKEVKLQQKQGTNWVDVLDILPLLNPDATNKTFEVNNLDNSIYRLYVDANQGTQNSARIVFDDLAVYKAGTGSYQDLTPSILGTKDYELVTGSTLPNFLDGVSAKDVDGITIPVTITENTVDVTKVGNYSVTYRTQDLFGHEVTKDIVVRVKDEEVFVPGDYSTYYASLNGKSQSEMKSILTTMVKSNGRATGSTEQVKTVDSFEGKNYNIYTGFGSYGNREHVWPNSKLGSAPDYDLHNLRAAVVSVNSTRSNYPFTNQVTQTNWQLINGKFYPGKEHVGDVARIVLYISLRYNLSLNLVGNLEMFLTWHEEDPVSPFEISRNNKIYSIQNNRNPFIDHPEFVNLIYS